MVYAMSEASGCMDQAACNYDMNATNEDGSCEFPATTTIVTATALWIWTETVFMTNWR